MPPRKRQRYILGVDLGGTNIVAGAMPEDGSQEIAMRSEPTLADEGADAVVNRIASMIEKVIAQTISETGAVRGDFAGVGIGSPGPLDREKGIVIVTPNLGWRNFPLRDEVSNRVGLPASAMRVPGNDEATDVRAVLVPPAAVLSVTPVNLDVITERVSLQDGERFDLVIGTNVFVYYDPFEQALAAANVAAMLRPGGVLLSNNDIYVTTPMKPTVGHLPVSYSDRQHDNVFSYQRQ